LFVADLFQPVNRFAVELFLNGDVGHGAAKRRANVSRPAETTRYRPNEFLQSVALGDDLNSLSDGLNLMFRSIPGITNQPLAQKVLSAFQVATTSAESDQLLSLMGKGHPGLNRCLGLAFAEQVTNVTTYEVRELASAGTPGDVIGRVRLW
jgi:hypothetical protein